MFKHCLMGHLKWWDDDRLRCPECGHYLQSLLNKWKLPNRPESQAAQIELLSQIKAMQLIVEVKT